MNYSTVINIKIANYFGQTDSLVFDRKNNTFALELGIDHKANKAKMH